MPEQTINLTDACIYIIGAILITSVPTFIKLIVDGARSADRHKENNKDIKAIKRYIKDKGVDDFCAECKR